MQDVVINKNIPPVTKIPYICSLTTAVRLMAGMSEDIRLKIRDIVEATVEQIDADTQLKKELKEDPINDGKHRVMRQVDIKAGPKDVVLFKIFAWWNKGQDRWHMLVEFPHEKFWENGGSDNRNL